jgi:hypothetical protein
LYGKVPELLEKLREAFLEQKNIVLGKRSIEDTVNFLKRSKGEG